MCMHEQSHHQELLSKQPVEALDDNGTISVLSGFAIWDGNFRQNVGMILGARFGISHGHKKKKTKTRLTDGMYARWCMPPEPG